MSITTVTDLWRMGATELAEAIGSGQVSSCEVVEAHLRWIEEVNPPSTRSRPSWASRR